MKRSESETGEDRNLLALRAQAAMLDEAIRAIERFDRARRTEGVPIRTSRLSRRSHRRAGVVRRLTDV
jgi:hypothetical protein